MTPPGGAVDRALGWLGFRLQQRFARRLPREPAPADARGVPLPELRYRLRRDGFRAAHLRACFAAYATATGAAPASPVLAAARRLVEGGVVELQDTAQREQALALAGLAHALHGGAVHVLAPSEAAAQRLATALRPALEPLGMTVGFVGRNMAGAARAAAYASQVVCAPLREVAQDYLRDVVGGARPRRPACALVDDADLALVDDTVAPVVIAGDAEPPADRLVYEQAVELARGLAPGSDFALAEGAIRLTPAARDLLERLVAPLGGAWAVRGRREALVELALAALHRLRPDVDYKVVESRVLFPPPEEGREPDPEAEQLQRLVEVKEGVPFGARREVRARLAVPGFLRRYVHLAGVAADCRGLEDELWSVYSLKTVLAGPREPTSALAVRVFASAAARRDAVVAAVRTAAAEGREALVVARSPEEARALRPALGEAALTVFSPTHGLPPRRTTAPGELVVAEMLDSRRHAAWLRRAWGAERCALLVSLEDSALAETAGTLTGTLRLVARAGGELPAAVSRRALAALQGAVERANRDLRQDMALREQSMEDLLALSGQRS